MKWYYLGEENEVIGPVSERVLRELKACGEIKNETHVCREGSEDWIIFEEISDPTMAPSDIPEVFEFNCQHCRQRIAAEPSQGGMEVQCLACGGKMRVPKFPPSNPSGKKVINHVRPKVIVLSVFGLAGLLAIGYFALSNRSSSHQNGKSKEYRSSAGSLPNLSRLVPEGFALIPEGAFTMGDSLDGMEDAPPHDVYLSSFYSLFRRISG